MTGLLIALVALVVPVGAAAQPAPASSYEDETARRLHTAAMAQRERLDESVLSYTAVVRQRVGVALRMPLKDRTLYRQEASHRLWWNRDSENLIQVLSYREQTPAGVNWDDVDLDLFNTSFDPMNDRLFFGMTPTDEDLGEPGGDDFWFEHPLYEEYVESYRFSTGDTITISLPDGRSVRAVELRVVPREADVHRMAGALWIEPETGALVRAVYRLADTFDAFRDIPDLQEEEDEDLSFIPGMFKPWTVEIRMISVDYGLWDFETWMPRSMHMEGVVAAGIIKAPVRFDYAYELESVSTRRSVADGPIDDLPEMRFATRSEAMAYLNRLAFGRDVDFRYSASHSGEDGTVQFLMPTDKQFLAESPELPPPVWDDGMGFATTRGLRDDFDILAALPSAPVPRTPTTFRWGWQRPDLIRYNRIEGVSVGARAQARPQTPFGPLSVTATARLGYADWEPNGHLEFARETLRRRVALAGYHELAAIEPEARHLGLGNSMTAFFFGRDDGDYYRRSGGSLTITPPSAGRRSYRLRGWAEYHRPVMVDTRFAVFQAWKDAFAFRPNLAADEGWEYGAALDLSPWWGTDPRLAQGGLDLTVMGATGMSEFGRASLLGRLIVPLPADLRLALEAGGGTTVGTPTVQRLWYVGGSRTLRGYAPRQMAGERMVRGRAELGRLFTWGGVTLFSDYAWAGDPEAFTLDAGFYSVGTGFSFVDGLIRFDIGYGLRQPRDVRIDFYLDAMM